MNKEKDTIYITYLSFRDDLGRYHFTMEWWQDNFHLGPSWRGQCYFGDPILYIEKYRKLGLKIVEITRRDLN